MSDWLLNVYRTRSCLETRLLAWSVDRMNVLRTTLAIYHHTHPVRIILGIKLTCARTLWKERARDLVPNYAYRAGPGACNPNSHPFLDRHGLKHDPPDRSTDVTHPHHGHDRNHHRSSSFWLWNTYIKRFRVGRSGPTLLPCTRGGEANGRNASKAIIPPCSLILE